jgi:hypothetical protein
MTGSNSSSRVLTVAGDGSSTNSDGRLELANTRAVGSIAPGDTAGRVYFVLQNNNGLTAVGNIVTTADGNGGSSGFGGKIQFQTKDDNSTNLSSKMVIDSSGKVGIGTTTPSSPLTVNGVIESKTGGIKFPDGTTQTSAATSGGMTVVEPKCWYNANQSGTTGCTPSSCPTGWTDLGLVNTVATTANFTSNWTAGYSSRYCSSTTIYSVIEPKCWYNANQSGTTGCTPSSCPTGWTDLGLVNTVATTANFTSNWTAGYSSRFCVK